MTGAQACRTLVRTVSLAALAGLAATSLGAQSQPAFRSAVDSVRIDARVVTDDGAFVRGLTQSDFRVFEDGREQTVTAFSMVELSPPVIGAGPAVPSDVSSNTSFSDGRVYLLVLDDLHIHELRAVTVRDLAKRFIEHYTSPADRVAIATTSGLTNGTQDFTNDRARLLDTVARFKSRLLPEATADNMPEFDAARAQVRADGVKELPAPITTPSEVIPLQSLLASVEWLGTVPDRRKALVLIGEGMLDRTTDPEVEGTIREIVSAAARANVAIYSVDAHGLPTGPFGAVKPVVVSDDDSMSERRRRQQQGMRLLAEETGGSSVVNSNAFDPLFARVVSDSSAYYLLGYSSTNKPTKKLKQIEVRVARPGTTVQVRRGYGEPLAATKRAAPQKGLPPAINAAFQSPVPLTGIELAVSTSPLRGSGQRISVAVIVEARGNSEMELFIGASQDGKVEASQRGTLKPAAGSAAASTMQAVARIDLQPGRYHLRVAALQPATGALGSVLHDFEVPDFSKENLAMTTLTLIDPARARTPTMRRTFSQGESIDVATEVYWKRGLKEPIAIAATVTSESGDEVYRQAGAIEPGQWPKHGLDVGNTIELARWQPGVYRLAVEAKTAGGKPLAAKRELTFVVTER